MTTIGAPATRVLDSGLPNARIGAVGEALTALALHKFAERHPEVVVAHSLSISGSSADIDHVVVIGGHITVIDSKWWSSRREWALLDGPDGSCVAVSTVTDENTGKITSLEHFPISVKWQASRIREVFADHDATGLICVHGLDNDLHFPAVVNHVHPRSPAYVPVLSAHYLVKRLEYTWLRQRSQTVAAEVIDRLRVLAA